MKRAAFVLIITLITGCLGCSTTDREDLVIARVEGKDLTVGQFEKVQKVIDESYLPDTKNLEGKKKILDYMIAKEVMILRANDMGYRKNEKVRAFENMFKGPFLVGAITKYYIRDKVKVNEKEVDEYYEKMKNEFVLSEITVLDSMKALKIRDEVLEEGTDFAEAARKYSITRTAKDGGKLGAVSIGEMYWWVEEALLDTEEGDITLPLRTENEFRILKVHDRRTVTPERDKEYARKRARAIKENKRMQKVKQGIMDEMGYKIYPDALEIAYNSLPEDISMKDVMDRKVTRKNAPKFNLSNDYQGMIMCEYEGNTYTLADFKYLYENLDLPARPRRTQGRAGIVNTMNKKFFNDVLPEYAEKRLKLMEDPEIKGIYDRRVEQVMLSSLYNETIKGKVQVTQQEIDDYYKENEAQLVTKEKREFTVILNSDRKIIEKARKLAGEGKDFEFLVENFSEDEAMKEKNGKVKMHAENKDSKIDEIGFSLPEGAISKPFKTGRGWMLLKVEKIVEAMKVSKEQAVKSIRSTLKQEKINELFDKKVAEWRKNYSIEVYEENLAKAKLTRTK
ncbi:MAG TPA: peptidyl-prolyl cis-trans isomerase [Candidatus Krumholzibacteriaceae bacterium]|nr:peptidyl-prolyl cis-trans isomerase [Candidatus Krumholzibacteriaceae bacterium]